MDELIEACGPNQAACAIPTALLETVAWEAEADGIAWNAQVAASAQHTGPVRDWVAEANGGYLR
ncbi:MAG: hypothetical protein ACRDQF_01605 [Thermocrispum sp.]